MVTLNRSLSKILLFGALVLIALLFGFVFSNYGYNAQGGVVVFLVLLLVGAFLIKKMSRIEPGRFFLTILAIGFGLKLVAAMSRMAINESVYGGLYDAGRYDRSGNAIANSIWNLDFAAVSSFFRFGTPFMEFWSGVSHALTGPTVIGSYLIFAVLAFIGSFFFYRAFCVAFPYGNRYLYAILAFLYPAILYWPNGLGKDAWMALCIGLAAYGGALLLKRGGINGLLPLALGLYGAFTVRPHVAGIIGIALLTAFLLGKGSASGLYSLSYRLAIVVMAAFLIWQFMPTILDKAGLDDFTLDSTGLDTTQSYFEKRQRSTGGGGAAFKALSFGDPLFVPKAVMTMLFRPFLWEAHNFLALIQAADSTMLLGLFVWRARSLGRALAGIRSSPFVIFILVYVILLSVALMTVANFGTLARERAMLLPLVFMLIAFQGPEKKAKPASSGPVGRRAKLLTKAG